MDKAHRPTKSRSRDTTLEKKWVDPLLERLRTASKDRTGNASGRREISRRLVEDAIEGLQSTLPPLVHIPDLIGLTRRGLSGDELAKLSLTQHLQLLENYNQALRDEIRPVYEHEWHKSVLSKDYLGKLREVNTRRRSSDPHHEIVMSEDIVVLVGSAFVAGEGSYESTNGFLGAIIDQLCMLNPLVHQAGIADSVLEGFPSDSFVGELEFAAGGMPFGPGGGEGRLPRLPGPPGGRGSGSPVGGPRAWGGAPGWPGRAGSPPPVFPDWLECLPEAIQAFTDVIGPALGSLRYTIDSIDPPHACPREWVEILGDRFSFQGATGSVRFKSLNGPTDVVVRSPEDWTNNRIYVQVPDEAIAGRISLGYEEPISYGACGHNVELNLVGHGEFEGGLSRITTSTSDTESVPCSEYGETIVLGFRTYNIDRLTFTVTDEDEIELHREEFRDAVPSSVSYRIPVIPYEPLDPDRYYRDRLLKVTLSVAGPCGEDELERYFAVARLLPLRTSELESYVVDQLDTVQPAGSGLVLENGDPAFGTMSVTNWKQSIDSTMRFFAPRSLQELQDLIVFSEAQDLKISSVGTAYSLSNCAIPRDADRTVMADTRFLQNILPVPGDPESTFDLRAHLRTEITSVLSRDAQDLYSESLGRPLRDIRERLVHVEAGIKINKLNWDLDALDLALPTMGGSSGQSLAGVVSTATHGSTLLLPPICDFVRAIHLVGRDGQQWWIEPRSRPITAANGMESARREGHVSYCLKVEYSDSLFYSTLVSLGNAGVMYSLVVEAVDKHFLRYQTEHTSWSRTQSLIDQIADEGGLIVDGGAAWFVEFIVQPSNRNHISTDIPFTHLSLTPESVPPRPPPPPEPGGHNVVNTGWEQLLSVLGATGLLGVLVTRYIARESFLMFAIPPPFSLARRRALKDAKNLWQLTKDLAHSVGSSAGIVDIHRVGPRLFNALWHLGLIPFMRGHRLFDIVMKIFVSGSHHGDRPEKDEVQESFIAFQSQDRDKVFQPSPESLTARHVVFDRSLTFDKLVLSHEYVLPAADAVTFLTRLLDIADDIRDGVKRSKAFLLAMPVRFTQPTDATIGMQQHEGVNAHIELFVMEGLEGTAEFIRRARAVADDMNAIPHWGQMHTEERDFDELYGENLSVWRLAMQRLNGYLGPESSFATEFARERRLIR